MVSPILGMTSTDPIDNESGNPDLGAHAAEYAAAGFRVFPLWSVKPDGSCQCGKQDCKTAGKHPIGKLVPNGLHDATDDTETVERWWKQCPDANIGIATGGDIVALDADIKVEADGTRVDGRLALQDLLRSASKDLIRPDKAPPTAISRTGSGGDHWIFSKPEDVHVGNRQDLKLSDGRQLRGLDVRGDGGYIVAPPSLHKSGNRYRWLTEWGNLAACPLKILDELRREQVDTKPVHLSPRESSDEDTKRILEALACVPPDCHREDWIQNVGMPLHDHYGGSEEGFDIWDEWSSNAGAPIYPGRKDVRRQWDSFRGRQNPRGIASLWKFARQHGWIPTERTAAAGPILSREGYTAILPNAAEFSDEEIEEALSTEPTADLPPEIIEQLHGPIRAMYQWAMDCNLSPQPEVALASALAMVAGATGRRFIGPTNASASLAIAVLAPSGTGKDRAQECVSNFLEMFPGLKIGVLREAPFHRMQLDARLILNDGQLMLLLDEYGSKLKTWLDERKSGDTMSSSIRSLIGHGRQTFRLFPAGLGNPTVKEIGKDRWEAGVFSPAVSLFGFATPGQFFKALSVESMSDGFLGRHVIIATKEDELPDIRFDVAGDTRRPPEEACSWARAMQSVPIPQVAPMLDRILSVNGEALNDRGDATPRDPISVPWGEGGFKLFDHACRSTRQMASKALKDGSASESAILTRLPGQIAALSLLFAIGEEPHPRRAEIGFRHVQMAHSLALWSVSRLIQTLDSGSMTRLDFADAYDATCVAIRKKWEQDRCNDRIPEEKRGRWHKSQITRQARLIPHMKQLWSTLKEDPRFEFYEDSRGRGWVRVRSR